MPVKETVVTERQVVEAVAALEARLDKLESGSKPAPAPSWPAPSK
jgi:hypothetical protein